MMNKKVVVNLLPVYVFNHNDKIVMWNRVASHFLYSQKDKSCIILDSNSQTSDFSGIKGLKSATLNVLCSDDGLHHEVVFYPEILDSFISRFHENVLSQCRSLLFDVNRNVIYDSSEAFDVISGNYSDDRGKIIDQIVTDKSLNRMSEQCFGQFDDFHHSILMDVSLYEDEKMYHSACFGIKCEGKSICWMFLIPMTLFCEKKILSQIDIANISGDAYFHWNNQLKYFLFTGAWKHITGCDYLGIKTFMYCAFRGIHTDDFKLLKQLWKRLRDKTESGEGEIALRYRLANLEHRWLFIRIKKSETVGDIYVVDLLVRDINNRKLMMSSLQELNERMGMALEAADSSVWECDLKLDRYRWEVSSVFIQNGIRAVEQGDLVDFLKEVVQEDRIRLYDVLTRISTDGGTDNVRFQMRINGKIILVKAYLFRPRYGQKIVGLIQDINLLKQKDEQLRKGFENMASIMEAMPQIIFAIDEQGSIVLANDNFCQFIGVQHRRLIGMNIQLLPLELAERNVLLRRHKKVLYSKQTLLTKQEMLTGVDRNEHCFNMIRIYNDFQHLSIATVLCIGMDCTRELQSKNRLIESEARYRALFRDNISVMLLIEPDKGRIVNANQAACDFYGYTIHEIKRLSIYDINTMRVDELKILMRDVILKKRQSFHFKHKIANGNICDVEVYSGGIELDGKQLLYSIVHDETHRLRVEKELVEAKEKAEESDRLKSAFLANMSHEVRTPMNSILGFTELLLDQSLSVEERDEYVNVIHERGEDLMRLINDILDYSKLEAGQMQIIDKPCNLNFILEEVYQLFKEKVYHREGLSLRVVSVLADEDALIMADALRLKQVMYNLVGNAIKFTNSGLVIFGYVLKADKIQLFVRDTGKGIPEDEVKFVFDSFRQAHGEESRIQGGTGLGLAITRGLINIMGGEIHLSSVVNKGTKILIDLPNSILRESEFSVKDLFVEQPVVHDTYSWQGVKLLLVEDDLLSARLMKSLLRMTKIEILHAETGERAVSLFRENQDIAVVLMDIKLPDTTGIELTKIFKQMRDMVPVIAQTAFAMDGDEERCFQGGCDDYLTKPINKALLLEKLKRWLG